MSVARIITIIVLISLCFPIQANDEPADYRLRDIDGKLHRVSDYRGKWLIINFWATWCAPCIREMPELERFYRENRESAQVWGVTFEDTDRERIKAFVETLGVTYPILGYGQDPLTGYGNVTLLPTSFVIDRNGLFFHRFEGPISARDIVGVIE